MVVVGGAALLGLVLRASARRAKESEAHLERLRRLYSALRRTNQTIAGFKDRTELLAGVCRAAVEQGGFRFAWIAWTNPEGTSLHPAAQAAAPAGFVEECVRRYDEAPELRALVREQLALHKPVFVNAVESDPLSEPRRLALARAGVRSVAAIPILVGGRLVAILLVYSGEAGVFAGEERDLLQEMANDVGLALQHVEHGERHQVAMAALEHSESRLASILTSLNSGIWSADPYTRAMTYVNPAFERIFGHSSAEFLADPALRFRDIHPEDRESVAASYYAALEAAGNASFEYRLRLPNGETRWIQDRGWVVQEGGRAARFDGIAADITERKQSEEEIWRLNATLERRVAERTAQLEAANRELNAFSYSVSHDLRAPLRAIEGFSALLAERIGSRLDAEELGFLQRIRRGVARMSALIEGMLQLARLSTQSLHRTPVDLSAMAREIADELQAESPGRKVEWRIAPYLAADADAPLLRAALQNLLGNAWKFTGRVERPIIEMGSTTSDGEAIFWVRDNGAGFDMAYSDRLFDTFHRMHGEQEFPGTGIGLATVKRIISRHGGRIRAEAAPEAGATFYFSLGHGEPGSNAR